ncbi:alpha/beta fold hydrolase [Streptomyces sp. NPDC058257]|uniref:alpha/beta fold hydrolase n=1 Tax=Streptomyces sp. NPDC058257 TaxID=3346409 RepID=UPI0036EB5C38
MGHDQPPGPHHGGDPSKGRRQDRKRLSCPVASWGAGTGAEAGEHEAPQGVVVIEALKDRYTIVAPALSGSGATTDTGSPLTVDDLAAQVLGAVNAADLDAFHLAGHSLGATVAAAVAGKHPERVRSLFLHAGWAVTDAWQEFQFDLWQRLLRADKDLLSRVLQVTAIGAGTLADRGIEDFEQGVAGFNELFDVKGMARQSELNTRVDITAVRIAGRLRLRVPAWATNGAPAGLDSVA